MVCLEQGRIANRLVSFDDLASIAYRQPAVIGDARNGITTSGSVQIVCPRLVRRRLRTGDCMALTLSLVTQLSFKLWDPQLANTLRSRHKRRCCQSRLIDLISNFVFGTNTGFDLLYFLIINLHLQRFFFIFRKVLLFRLTLATLIVSQYSRPFLVSDLLRNSIFECVWKSNILQRVLIVEAWHHRCCNNIINVILTRLEISHLTLVHSFLHACHVPLHLEELSMLHLLVKDLLVTLLALTLLLLNAVLGLLP